MQICHNHILVDLEMLEFRKTGYLYWAAVIKRQTVSNLKVLIKHLSKLSCGQSSL